MQQLPIEHKNEAKKDRSSGKGRCIALSRRIYRILQTDDVFYVESESTDNVYYFVKFKPGVIEWCSCCDNSMRGSKRKHIWSIAYVIRLGIIKDIDTLPIEAKVKKEVATMAAATKSTKSYTEDDYSF
jgi:hypothetical protein